MNNVTWLAVKKLLLKLRTLHIHKSYIQSQLYLLFAICYLLFAVKYYSVMLVLS